MKYLLDVNALVALLVAAHVHHQRVRAWIAGLGEEDAVLLTPWTEVAFLRVGLAAQLLPDVATGRKLIKGISAGTAVVEFIADTSRARDLPAWASTPAKLGDGHLFALAESQGARLATFDQGIPGAVLIP